MIVRRPVAPTGGSAPAPRLRLALVDWEAAAVGSGPQDLGQFMISHASPASRRALAPAALRQYAADLAAAGARGAGGLLLALALLLLCRPSCPRFRCRVRGCERRERAGGVRAGETFRPRISHAPTEGCLRGP